MNFVREDNFNFFEKKKKTRVSISSANPEEEALNAFYDNINSKVNKQLEKANSGLGSLDDKIRNALKSDNDGGIQDDYYDKKAKKNNDLVESLTNDLKKKLSSVNAVDTNYKKRLNSFLSDIAKKVNPNENKSLAELLSEFKKLSNADSGMSEEFKSFLRSLKKLLESLMVKDSRIMIDLSEALELLNSDIADMNPIVVEYLKSLISGEKSNVLSDDILKLFQDIRTIKPIKDSAGALLSKILYSRFGADYEPVVVYRFNDKTVTEQNVLKLLQDSDIKTIYVDGENIKDYIDLANASGLVKYGVEKDVSLPVWAVETWRYNNEKRLKEFYKTVKSAETGSSLSATWERNEYVSNLNSLLNPTITPGENGMNPGIDPDTFARLIVQSYFTRGTNSNVIRSNVTLKNGTMIPKEIKMTKSDSVEFMGKDFFEIDDKELVKIFTQTTRNGTATVNNLLGHGILPHIQLSPEDNITPIGDTAERTDAAANLATQHAIHSSAVKCLLRKMPDFRPNMYYGVISQYNEDDEEITDILNITGGMPFEKELGAQLEQVLKTYFIRLQEVSINGMSIEPTTWKFMGRTISKVSSTFTESHKTELSFSLDQNGLILNKFNALAGIFGSNFEDKVSVSEGVDNNFYSQTFFPSTFFNNKSRIDITIMYNDFNTTDTENHFSSYGATQKLIMDDSQTVSNKRQNKTFGYQNSYRAFVFEDVRFLGSNSTLKFERDAGGRVTNVSIPILYKRITTIDNNL